MDSIGCFRYTPKESSWPVWRRIPLSVFALFVLSLIRSVVVSSHDFLKGPICEIGH